VLFRCPCRFNREGALCWRAAAGRRCPAYRRHGVCVLAACGSSGREQTGLQCCSGYTYCETVAASCDSAAPVARGGDRAIPNLLAHCGPGVHPSLTAIYPPTAICTHPPFCVDSLPSADLALLFLLLLLPALRSRAATAIVSPPSRHRASSAPNSSEPFSTAGVHAPAHTTATNSPAFTCTAPHRTRRGTHLPPSDRASH
jgi:hypothetical protein